MGPRQAAAAAHPGVGHDVNVDVAGAADGSHAGPGPGEQGGQPGPAARAEHQLGGVLRPGEGEQRVGDIVADHLVVGAAERLGEPALRGQFRRVGAGQPVGPGDMHGEQVAARGAGGDPGRAADQRLTLLAAGERHHHPFPRLPGAVDVVRGPVALQSLVHLVGQPEQGQLTQGGQVAGAEVVGQRGIDLLRRVDVPVRHPAAERLGRLIDQFDLVGGAHHGVGDRLPLRHAGDLLDHVVERFQVLDVDRGDDVDAGIQKFLDILPALGVAGTWHVGVRELVHESDLGPAGQHGVEVHLLEERAAVRQLGPGHDLQPVKELRSERPPVGLHERHDHVGPALETPVTLAEHGEGLADAGRRTKIDPELSPVLLAHGLLLAGLPTSVRFHDRGGLGAVALGDPLSTAIMKRGSGREAHGR